MTPRKPLRILFVTYPGGQHLDLAGPYEIFARASRVLRDEGRRHPGYSLAIVASQPGPLIASSGFRFLPDLTPREVRGPIDTLLVTGGIGVDRALEDRPLLSWLRRAAPRVRRLGSVCTGAFLLAEAGLLDGKRVATHWLKARALQTRYPLLKVEDDPIYLRDGKIVTSAGVTAGMDLALALIEEDLGAEVALKVARAMVFFLRRPGDQSQYSAPLRLQETAVPTVRDLIAWALEHPDADLSVPALARKVSTSPRNLARIFRRELGQSPAHAIEQLRVEAAQRGLCESRGSLDEVAARAGFGSAEVMRRAFLRLAHLTPSAYRERFGARAAAASCSGPTTRSSSPLPSSSCSSAPPACGPPPAS